MKKVDELEDIFNKHTIGCYRAMQTNFPKATLTWVQKLLLNVARSITAGYTALVSR